MRRSCDFFVVISVTWAVVFLITTPLPAAEPEECAKCHTHRFKLDDLTAPLIVQHQKEKQKGSFFQEGEGYEGLTPPKDLFQKMFIDEEFFKTPHGKIACSGCHQGDPEATEPDAAHKGMVTDPTLGRARETCGGCHQTITRAADQAFHAAGVGSMDDLQARCSEKQWRQLRDGVLQEYCASCHSSSCGSCHVSYPDVSGSGLVNNHMFTRTPDAIYQCASCHNVPVFQDMIGEFSRGDTHYRDADMTCTSCHRASEMHVVSGLGEGRYHNVELPGCLDCHQDVKTGESCGYRLHKGRVACTVCHSQVYQNCISCHMGRGEGEEGGHSANSPARLDFRIGLNPGVAADEPEYVLLRQIGIKKDSFQAYLPAGLAHYERRPTFKRTSPHNSQRHTWQNASCNHCHGNRDVFLTQEAVPPEDLQANSKVIVAEEDIPAGIDAAQSPPLTPSPLINREMRVSAQWLHDNLDQENLLIMDVRLSEDYEFEHIPGAVNLCACHFRTGFATEVPLQMKSPGEIASFLAEEIGLTSDRKVIIYGGRNRNWTGIAFVALEMIGHKNIAFLDGNFRAWTEAGYGTEWGSGPEVEPGSYTLAPREVLVDSGTIKESEGSDKLLILDGRILTQYSGDIPKTAIAETGGHIPGALSLPAASLFNTDGTFKSAERLEWLFRLYGITRENGKIVVATCNTNSLASNIYMILRYLGHDNVRLHDGAWAEWARLYKREE